MKLARFTDPNGHPVWIGPAWIEKIVPAIAETGMTKHANTIIHLSGGVVAVKEQPEDVIKALEIV